MWIDKNDGGAFDGHFDNFFRLKSSTVELRLLAI
eukprot:CAMPEP_0202024580 /NCGR_PEP_ID=MMETSP0905-20130828/54430_1 /ASSEMBLY_ACC=CAM_ASM_000554 /TAXON_ID=420261 /ORGANISM="Thalassiosira antarctica, Strain CCMP982" /LENGTH=33 /DNA_ID= /DNA_START= /DNA_END= /DNA_ORIENTATION=